MELNEYQRQAMTTCMPSSNNFAYMFNNLLGEVGELVDKVNEHIGDSGLACLSTLLAGYGTTAKKIRKEPENVMSRTELETYSPEIVREMRCDALLHKELGDIAWQLNGVMTVLNLQSEYIHQQNLDKLASRQERGKIDGNGDNR